MAGFVAEVVSCSLWVPIDVAKERLQVRRGLMPKYHHFISHTALAHVSALMHTWVVSPWQVQSRLPDVSLHYKGGVDALRRILKTEGIRGNCLRFFDLYLHLFLYLYRYLIRIPIIMYIPFPFPFISLSLLYLCCVSVTFLTSPVFLLVRLP